MHKLTEFAIFQKDKVERHKGFGDFFNLHTEAFEKVVKVISMHDFVTLEGAEDGQFPVPDEEREGVLRSSKECDKRHKSDIACDKVWTYLEASAFVPQFNSSTCVIFDEDTFETGHVAPDMEKKVKEFCDPREVSWIVRINLYHCEPFSFSHVP